MSGVTDLEFLRENTFSVENMRELIEIYLNTTPLMFNDLIKAAHSNDQEKMRRTAHKLKSNMNTMGVVEGSAILENIEQIIENKTNDGYSQYLQELQQVIKLSEAELNKVLTEL